MQFGNGPESRTTFIDRASQEKSLSPIRVIMVPSLIEKAEFFIRREDSFAETSRKLIILLIEKHYPSFRNKQHYFVHAIIFTKAKT